MKLQVRRSQVLLGVPFLLGLTFAGGLLGTAVLPSWQQMQDKQLELDLLTEQRERLPLLRRQLQQLEEQLELAGRRNALILGLIAGSGELETFMAQLSQQAAKAGVLLDGYEPVQLEEPQTPKKDSKRSSKNSKAVSVSPPKDPLLAPGLKKTSVLLSARGTGPQLLDFLRRLERLSLLVVQSDLTLKSGGNTKDEEGRVEVEPTELRLNLGLYSRDDSPAQKSGKPG